jgi:1-aminocyclopropane-1-carboxylate deaminase/D-cysteine desulfhydrase-like pyridoxal-dependent ACC family enzyme
MTAPPNHPRQVAAVSAHPGLRCVLVQESRDQALRDNEADGGTPGITREAR